jgi:putative oxidoreductase
MKRLLKSEDVPMLIPRLIVGIVFLSEGIQKYLFPDIVGVGRFTKIGFSHPEFWAYFTAGFEVVCGTFLFIGLLTLIVSIPLLIIMATAFVTTKYPVLLEKGFWVMAHEYRTDFAMTMLLLLLLKYGAGRLSLDHHWYERLKQ